MMSKKMQGNIMLVITAFIWGCAFVAQRSGMEYIGPFAFNGIRSLLGAFVLLPVIFVLGKSFSNREYDEDTKESMADAKGKIYNTKTGMIGGFACGLCLFAASTLQQMGMVYTTAGKAGFITALYIVMVPVLGIFIGKKVRPVLWICVVLAACGLYLLCMKEDFSISKGDFLELGAAFGFSLHILVVDYFSEKADGVKLSCMQFFVCGVLSIICMLFFETVHLADVKACAVPILYAGVMSCGVAYTFQIVAQKYTEPTVASLLMSLESVFAVLAGVLILHEQLSLKEGAGCLIMFAAIIIAQLPERKRKET